MSACIIFKRHVGSDGYGVLYVNGKQFKAHRISYMLHRGKIPNGLQVLHSCDVPLCINPEHLWLGTNTDNMKDKTSKGRHHRHKETKCTKGHEYTQENTYIYKNRRLCRACARQRDLKHRRKSD